MPETPPTSDNAGQQDRISNSAACRSFRPSKPPWPSQMCARCGEWREDHPADVEERP